MKKSITSKNATKNSKSIIYRHQMNSEYVWIDDCIPPCYNQSNFLKKPSHIISSSTRLPSPKDSGGSSPRNFGAAEWLPRGHGETQHRFHPIGAVGCGRKFSQKIKPGMMGKIGSILLITGFFEGDRCFFLFETAWTAPFVVDVYLFFGVFLLLFFVAQVFPRYAHLTLPPTPDHIPPFIPQVPMVTRAMMLRRCQCHRHHQRRFRQKQIRQRCGLGWKGIQEMEGVGALPSLKG